MVDTSNPEPPKLLAIVRGKIRLKHDSIRTGQAYADWIKRYILHFGKQHPNATSQCNIPMLAIPLDLTQKFETHPS